MKLCVSVLVMLAASTVASRAAIVCHDDFQVVNGQEIATPYCQDRTLAQVSRSHGREVSDAAVRDNPALKDELCRQFDSDIRAKGACASSAGQQQEGP
jgi:hypothetical protein